MEQGTNQRYRCPVRHGAICFRYLCLRHDSDVFHTWATEILLPELPACSVIVMDNASFHKRQDTLDALQAEGHTVLWLPPYSPDFNPIEKTWAWIKRLRKQWRLADVNALLFWFLTLVTLY